MIKIRKIVVCIIILFATFFTDLNAQGLGKEDNYVPDVKVTYAFANTPFSEAITTEEKLLLDKPFYILIEAAVKVPGIWHRIFGTKSIECGVSFRSPQIIKVSSVESTVAVQTLENLNPHIVYAFRIPATPDGQQKIHVVFYCEPQNTGMQEIRIAFDNYVDSMYRHTYNFIIKGIE
jgi:hypothetical protein